MRQLAAIILPARLNSSRLPKKLLQEVNGKSVIQTAYENAKKASKAFVVSIASDDTDEMYNHVKSFCPLTVKTPAYLTCGTHRVAYASRHGNFAKADIIVNVQGDEIGLDPKVIDDLIDALSNDPHLDMVTAIKKRSKSEKPSPNSTVEAVVEDGKLIDLVRFKSGTADKDYYEHIGVVAFRKRALYRFLQTTPTEKARLSNNEYITAIENNFRIGLVDYEGESKAVNTIKDLEGPEIEKPVKPKKKTNAKVQRKPSSRKSKI